MACPACAGERVVFVVPSSLRPYAPDESAGATLCTNCLRVEAAETPGRVGDDRTAAVDWEPLPTGEAGIAMALLLGHLDSLALRRADVTELIDRVETAGGDAFATLDRLVAMATNGAIDPVVDLDRRAAQLRSLLD
ncbi:DUF6276 family protein [Salinigranum salinum]|uniref:DUF6276 family protein n=1 Tax=Salinigranum salinum TaxID=1364937 RepID=UPI001260A1AD|nr:DUF6276 family protein [Salinigranum salinum]